MDGPRIEPPTTLVRGGWVVGYQDGGHRILADGMVVFRGDEILHVGEAWDGEPDQVVDAAGKLICPGFISAHAHAADHAGDRLVVDGGRRDLLRTGFLNYVPRRPGGPGFGMAGDPEASLRYGLATLIRHGVTTVVQVDGGPLDDGATMARLTGEAGLRAYYAPFASGGSYEADDHGRISLTLDEGAALAMLDRAADFVRRHDKAHDGRLRGMLLVDELLAATPRTLRHAKDWARRLGVGVTIHAAEQVYEFHHILRTTGLTPVGWMAAEGFLGPETVLAHCVYMSGHGATGYPFAGDLETLAASGATIAHCPVALARRGVALESYQRCRDAGVRLAIGTDSYPLDIVAEMTAASLIGKVVDRSNEAAAARDVFNAATIGGADALGRPDLGRLAPGARADLTIVDLAALRVGPVRDPIRALLHAGVGELVDTVIVAGQTLLRDRRLVRWDETELSEAAARGARRIWAGFADYHWSRADIDSVFPPSFAVWQPPSRRHRTDPAPPPTATWVQR